MLFILLSSPNIIHLSFTMYTSSLFLAVLVGIAQAQTPEGFVPAVSIKLDLLYNSTTIQAPGQQLSKSGTLFLLLFKSKMTSTNTLS